MRKFILSTNISVYNNITNIILSKGESQSKKCFCMSDNKEFNAKILITKKLSQSQLNYCIREILYLKKLKNILYNKYVNIFKYFGNAQFL